MTNMPEDPDDEEINDEIDDLRDGLNSAFDQHLTSGGGKLISENQINRMIEKGYRDILTRKPNLTLEVFQQLYNRISASEPRYRATSLPDQNRFIKARIQRILRLVEQRLNDQLNKGAES